jgi:hypothetical protein
VSFRRTYNHRFCCHTAPDSVAYNYTTHWANVSTPDFKAGTTALIEYHLQLNLVADTYHLGVDLARHDLTSYFDKLDRVLDFVVTGGDGARGIANLQASFTIRDTESTEVL